MNETNDTIMSSYRLFEDSSIAAMVSTAVAETIAAVVSVAAAVSYNAECNVYPPASLIIYQSRMQLER